VGVVYHPYEGGLTQYVTLSVSIETESGPDFLS
jgi:hypothetical protein